MAAKPDYDFSVKLRACPKCKTGKLVRVIVAAGPAAYDNWQWQADNGGAFRCQACRSLSFLGLDAGEPVDRVLNPRARA